MPLQATRFLRPALLLAALVLVAPLAPRTLRAAEAAWKVLFNGHPSQTRVMETDGRAHLPVSFPLEPGESTWEVTLKVDEAGRTVQVLRTRKTAPVRDDAKCWFCSGDGQCHSCYPAGSGANTAGLPCNVCNGTGDCDSCDTPRQR